MTRFRYKAVAPSGEVVEGELDGDSRKAVVERLRGSGHLPIRAEESRPKGAGRSPRLRGRRAASLGSRDVMVFTQELATLAGAGLPLDRALSLIAGLDETGPVGRLAASTVERVRRGASLAEALSAHEAALPNYYLGMVRAGEAGGHLDTVLTRLAETIERSEALKANVRSALTYPAIVLCVAALSIVVLLTAVIPEFKPLFESSGAELPTSTRVVLGLSEAFNEYWWAFGAGLAILSYAAWEARRRPAGRRRIDRWVLASPRLGEVVRNVEVTRYTRTLGTLLGNGVSMLNAVAIAADSLGNTAVRDALGALQHRVKKGEGLAAPLEETGVVPTRAVQLVRVGEESGQLEAMLLKIAAIYDDEVRASVQRFLSFLVPAVTLALGILVAGIIGSILSALLSSYQLPL